MLRMQLFTFVIKNMPLRIAEEQWSLPDRVRLNGTRSFDIYIKFSRIRVDLKLVSVFFCQERMKDHMGNTHSKIRAVSEWNRG